MSNFFVPTNRSNADASAKHFSVSAFSACQKAHAYAEIEAKMTPQTMQANPTSPTSGYFSSDSSFESSAPVGLQEEMLVSSGTRSHRRAWVAGIAFFTTVFASMAAAATVASSDFPLMIVGL